jgi:heterodisulfide reductase subunit C
MGKKDTIKVKELDSNFKFRVTEEPGGEHLLRCFACGTCTASCPVREIDERFNPRKIIRMTILGMKDEVLNSDFVWLCSTCYACQERCPQDVVITELMNALKNIAVKEGIIHPGFVAQASEIGKFGRLYEIDDFANKKRDKMGLPALKSEAKDVQKIYEITGVDKHISQDGEKEKTEEK